jgi:hypothetical protein
MGVQDGPEYAAGGVVVDLGQRQFLAQPVALTLVALGVDRLREQERLV